VKTISYNYFAEILIHCVKTRKKSFKSAWFYEAYPEAKPVELQKLVRNNYIKAVRENAKEFFICNFYSHLRYIGLCCAAFIDNNPEHKNADVTRAMENTGINSDLTYFLNSTYDLSSQEKSEVLDIELNEIKLLEDYYFMRLARNFIILDIKLPSAESNDLSIFQTPE
jgi:hypothetical protein